MFGIGWAEFLFIAVIALLVLGPEKLPEIARQMGRWMRELRRISADLRREFDDELYADTSGVSSFAELGVGSGDLDGAADGDRLDPPEGDFGTVIRGGDGDDARSDRPDSAPEGT